MIKFKNLPEEIQERMLNEQVRQGNLRNAKVFEKRTAADITEGGFYWDGSVEGYNFWNEVIVGGNFDVFYEKHLKEPNRLYTEEEVRNLFIKRCKKFSTQHEKFDELLLEQDLKWFEENKK